MPEIPFNDRPHKNEKQESIDYVKSLIEQARTDARDSDIPKLEKLIQLLNSKKYGLVWEEHAELVEEEMKTKIPVFVEDESKKINDNPDSEDFNFLLEGDNLHSLHLLEKTHTGKIDVIYIDPPYNTGKVGEFTYNDKTVDNNDNFSHSKWLSFMERRLRIAKVLLSERGLLFVSISDSEQGQLKLLLDEIFGENNLLADIIWNSTKSVTNTAIISVGHTYNFVFAKNINYWIKNRAEFRLPESGDGFSNPDNDLRGAWKADPFQVGGWRPNQQYEITNPNTGKVYKPNKGNSWKNDFNKFEELVADNRIIFGKNGISAPQRKRFLSEATGRGKVAKTWWDDVETTTNGTQQLKNLFEGEAPFTNPKPVGLIKRILQLSSNKKSTILDFFAGSGTTGQAVMELNNEDGGNRKFILATNNENNIAEEVTYERMKRVSAGTEKYEAKPMNLKYFKTDFVIKEDFPDISLEYELLRYITPLVELEFGVDITNPKVQIVITDEQLESLIENKELVSQSTLFMHPDVFRDAGQSQVLSDLQIEVQEIPNYFFGTEMWSK